MVMHLVLHVIQVHSSLDVQEELVLAAKQLGRSKLEMVLPKERVYLANISVNPQEIVLNVLKIPNVTD